MKLTLLEIIQDMLTATDSENVSDVGETEELFEVSKAIRYYSFLLMLQRSQRP